MWEKMNRRLIRTLLLLMLVLAVQTVQAAWGLAAGESKASVQSWSALVERCAGATSPLRLRVDADIRRGAGSGEKKSEDLVIPGGAKITLELNGHTIDAADRGVIWVYGQLTLEGGDLVEPEDAGRLTGGDILAADGGSVYLLSGEISGSQASRGVSVDAGSLFVMSGGSISGNAVNGCGGGVYVAQGGTFRMSGGTIAGNKATDSGGGIFIAEGGSFAYNDGEVEGNAPDDIYYADEHNDMPSASPTSGTEEKSQIQNPAEVPEESSSSGNGCPQDESCPIAVFWDADPKAWYHDGMHYVLEQGLMAGYSPHHFGPENPITRATIVTILWRLSGQPASGQRLIFSDVEGGQWYTEAIRWAVETGVASGYRPRLFGTGDPITREQLASLLYKYARAQGGRFTGVWPAAGTKSSERGVSDWAADAMAWAEANGMIEMAPGRTTRRLPQDPTSRAETAVMLTHLCELLR